MSATPASTTSKAKDRAYGYALAYESALPCENQVVAQLVELRRQADLYLRRDGWVAEDELFFAEQNARVVRDAEEYYQQMYRGSVSSWNLRDRHMANTLDALLDHLDGQFGHAKVVVWEHNSHVGDARATAMGERGELNVGQLARQRYGDRAALIGFTTYDGEVTAADDWGGRARAAARAACPGDQPRGGAPRGSTSRAFWVDTRDADVRDAFTAPRLERAIGVIYRPETERQSHYFAARIADQFDVVHAPRPDACLAPARADRGLGPGRATRDVPDRAVTEGARTESRREDVTR